MTTRRTMEPVTGDAATDGLARELVEITGESVAAAVREAVRERLDRVRRERGSDLVERLLAIGRDCAAHLDEPYRSADHGELLYGDREVTPPG